jgi:hypothetical protein
MPPIISVLREREIKIVHSEKKGWAIFLCGLKGQ